MPLADYADHGLFAPGKIAAAWRTTGAKVAASAGLGRDALQRRERVTSDRVQRPLRQMVEVVNMVEPRFGSALMAYAWYRSEPLPDLGGRTAMRMVQDGHADEVLALIDAVDAGIHA